MHHIGIDVSKDKLDCLWLRDKENKKIKTKIHKNTGNGHKALHDWIVKNIGNESDDIHITIEATGIYHECLAQYLYDTGYKVSVVNPALPRNYAKGMGITHKNDKVDSYVLALYGYNAEPSLWKPEPKEIRVLKALTARLESLQADLQREKNRLEKADFTNEKGIVTQSLNNMIQRLISEIKSIEDKINDHIDGHPYLKKDRALLQSIPGVGPVLSRVMLGVIHSRDFSKASQVAAFLGLIPVHNESGAFKGQSRLSKRGSGKVRSKLYMGAIVAWSWNPDLKEQKERLLRNGKTKMSALGACMRKLVQICFGVIKNQTEYQSQVA